MSSFGPYCYSNNGMSFRAVDPDYIAGKGEVIFTDKPTTDQLTAAFLLYSKNAANQTIKDQIAALEAQQTDRRVREAIAGTDSGWLSNLNTQIAALRSQLT